MIINWFKKQLWFFWVIVLVALGFASLTLSPFGIADRLDNYSQDLFNQFAGNYELIYPATGQREISVLLLTDQTVDAFHAGKWPISYDAHGKILRALLRHRPKAVAIDFFWLNQDKPGINYLIRILERYKQENIPVYLAFRNAEEQNDFWPELSGLVIPVSASISLDPSDFVARKYLVDSPELDPIAIRIYRDLYDQNWSTADAPEMQIFWGTRTNPQNAAWMDPGDTKDGSLNFLLEGFSAVKYRPPYTTTILVRDLLNPTAENDDKAHHDLSSHISNRVVFYGGQIDGVTDRVYTPTRYVRPGVYYHAMALDNLISYDGAYLSRDIKPSVSQQWWHLTDWMLTLLILFIPSTLVIKNHERKKRQLEGQLHRGFAENLRQKPFDAMRAHLIAKNLLLLRDRLTQNWCAIKQGIKRRVPIVELALTGIERIVSFIAKQIYARFFLWVFIIAVILMCHFILELSAGNWIGYLALAEIGFYIDTIFLFEVFRQKLNKEGHYV